jgi:hypothetical protein
MGLSTPVDYQAAKHIGKSKAAYETALLREMMEKLKDEGGSLRRRLDVTEAARQKFSFLRFT